MVASTLFTVFGLGALCCALFNLLVYALPFWVGLASGLFLHDAGHGLLLSLGGGLFAGAAAVVAGEIAFASVRSAPVRAAIGLLYAVPAGIAGFHATQGLASLGGAGETAILVLSWLGAFVTSGTAWARVSGRSHAEGAGSSPILHRQTANDG